MHVLAFCSIADHDSFCGHSEKKINACEKLPPLGDTLLKKNQTTTVTIIKQKD